MIHSPFNDPEVMFILSGFMEYLVKLYDMGKAPSALATMSSSYNCNETWQIFPKAYIATTEVQ
jgi:hypothetical protein